MRTRLALGVALALVVGEFLLLMSGSASRISGTDHINPVGFYGTIQGGQELCQPTMELPKDAGGVRLLAATYGHPLPALSVRFIGPHGTLTSGRRAAGAPEGPITVALRHPHGPSVAGTLCVGVGPSPYPTVLGGDQFAPGPESEQIAGKPQGGRIAVIWLRPGSESWWQLLPTLSRRFGLGKASFFGTWTLLALALLLLGVWIGALRLLVRELT